MRRQVIFIVLLLLGVLIPASAQELPRDYAVSNPRFSFSDDEQQLIIQVDVRNLGGPTEVETSARLIWFFGDDDEEQEVLESQEIAPLEPGVDLATVTFTIQLDTTRFPPGSQQPFHIEVGVDEEEPEDNPLSNNNTATLSVPIPTSAGSGGSSGNGESGAESGDGGSFVIPVLDVELDLSNPLHIVGVAVVLIFALVLLWLLTIILRLIFRRPPKFENWQPPYATTAYHDPNSTLGRRFAWQQHAQNGSILTTCTEGAVHAVKQLVGREDNHKLSNWRIVAMRISQYDMYGRVSRSEVVAPRGLVKRLDRAARQSQGDDADRIRKRVTPVARSLTRLFGKKITRRGAMLPVALDIRFEGRHGEVRIIFELYRCDQFTWQQIDNWEPEMTVMGRSIRESYTYTIHGMSGGETLKDYRKRLKEDIIWLLTEMLHQPHHIERKAERGVVPDTLTDMEPVKDA